MKKLFFNLSLWVLTAKLLGHGYIQIVKLFIMLTEELALLLKLASRAIYYTIFLTNNVKVFNRNKVNYAFSHLERTDDLFQDNLK